MHNWPVLERMCDLLLPTQFRGFQSGQLPRRLFGAMAKNFAAALFILLVGGLGLSAARGQATSSSLKSADSEGREYRDTLVETIRHANQIIVTEHSDLFAAYRRANRKFPTPAEVVYGTRKLSDEQKQLFLSTVEALDPGTQVVYPLCIFEPHHTIRFYVDDKVVSTMFICFKCNQVEWTRTGLRPPESLYSGLAAVIKEIGLSPKRDWEALARQHLR